MSQPGTVFGVPQPTAMAASSQSTKHAQEAVKLWNQRTGAACVAGGRATRGLRSRRKVAAARRNLKKARSAKQLKRVRDETEYAIAQLRPLREAEQIRLECLVKRSRARLATVLPQIAADPVLSRMLALLKPDQAISDPGQPVKDPLAVKQEFAAAP